MTNDTAVLRAIGRSYVRACIAICAPLALCRAAAAPAKALPHRGTPVTR